ncbi:hypothetical protein AaE_005599, partial [Aphanomyces astaci]
VRKKKFIKTTVGDLKNGTLKRQNNAGGPPRKQKIGETYKKWQQKQHKRANVVGADEGDDSAPKGDYRNGRKPPPTQRVNKFAKSELREEGAIRKEEKRKAKSSGDKSKFAKKKPQTSRGKGNVKGKTHGAPTKSKMFIRR